VGRGPALVVVAVAGACSAADYERRADRAVEGVLERGFEQVLGGRQDSVLHPAEVEPAGPAGAETGRAPEQEPAREPELLDLEGALAIAFRSNRGFADRKDSLYLSALSLTGTRWTFSPQVTATLGYLFADVAGAPWSQGADLDLGVSQLLPFGGSASVSAGTSYSDGGDSSADDPSYGSSLSFQLTQPLLRGAGHEVAFESLVQAERDLVYAIRDFELFREDFAIDVARRFYDLVEQKKAIENQRASLDGFVFDREKAEAFFRVGRTTELDVLRARRNELDSRNALIEAEEGYLLALDRFEIFLGLPATAAVDVQGDPPAFVPGRYDVDSAVEVALRNRLDVLNRREQLEDVERSVRIARNGLLPDLDLSFGSGFSTGPGPELGGGSLQNDSYTVGLTLDLPLDRVSERNGYRSAQFALARARRSYDEFEDQLVVEIRSAFRELERRFQSLEIQRRLIEDQQRNVEIAELRFERGELPNRDVVEARLSLLEAQNSLIDEQVSYEVARLQLLRNMGILFIDENGMWM